VQAERNQAEEKVDEPEPSSNLPPLSGGKFEGGQDPSMVTHSASTTTRLSMGGRSSNVVHVDLDEREGRQDPSNDMMTRSASRTTRSSNGMSNPPPRVSLHNASSFVTAQAADEHEIQRQSVDLPAVTASTQNSSGQYEATQTRPYSDSNQHLLAEDDFPTNLSQGIQESTQESQTDVASALWAHTKSPAPQARPAAHGIKAIRWTLSQAIVLHRNKITAQINVRKWNLLYVPEGPDRGIGTVHGTRTTNG